MATRRSFLGQSLMLLSASGLAAVPGLARAFAREGNRELAISESFTFPEWHAAIAAVSRSGTNSADRAFVEAARALAWAASAESAEPVGAGGALRLVALVSPGVEAFEPGQARELAALGNERLAEYVREQRGSVAGLATICAFDPQAVQAAERALGRYDMVGLSLGANRGLRIDNPALRPLLDLAASSGVPVYLPAGYSSLAGDGPYRAQGRCGELLGASADSAAHARQLIFGGVLDRYPALRVVLGQMGAGAPYWLGQIHAAGESLARSGAPAPRRAALEYFGTNIYLSTAGMGTDALRSCSALLDEGSLLPVAGAAAPEFAALDPGLRARTMRLTKCAAAQLLRRA